jgi:transcriptional regulator with XRE-family HTH domain
MKSALDGLDALIDEAGLSLQDLATALGLSVPAVSNKRAGRRRWSIEEVNRLLPLLSKKLRRKITYEKVCATPATAAR